LKIPRLQIVYDATRGGVPLPRRISSSYPGVATIRTLDIENIEFGPLPESEFTLSAYGLPELDASHRPKRGNRLAVVLFLGAFVALSIALALKYYARRIKKNMIIPV